MVESSFQCATCLLRCAVRTPNHVWEMINCSARACSTVAVHATAAALALSAPSGHVVAASTWAIYYCRNCGAACDRRTLPTCANGALLLRVSAIRGVLVRCMPCSLRTVPVWCASAACGSAAEEISLHHRNIHLLNAMQRIDGDLPDTRRQPPTLVSCLDVFRGVRVCATGKCSQQR